MSHILWQYEESFITTYEQIVIQNELKLFLNLDEAWERENINPNSTVCHKHVYFVIIVSHFFY
jgi:hypothetical protein